MKTRKIFRASIYGISASGKTALRLALQKEASKSEDPKLNFTSSNTPTLGIDFSVFQTDTDSKLHLWDLSGSERFMSIALAYTTGNIFYLTIDPYAAFHPKDPVDFATQKERLDTFMQAVGKKRESQNFANQALQINLIVTKSDLLPKLSADDQATLTNDLNKFSQELSDKFNVQVPVIYTSAKQATGLTEILQTATKQHIDSTSNNEFHSARNDVTLSVCDAYTQHVSKRVFLSTDPTRNSTVTALRKNLEGATDVDQLKEALIQSAKDIRTPVNSRYKYGVTFFFGFFHYGSYQNSHLYKLIKKQLAVLDKNMDLDALSKPDKPVAIKPTSRISPAHSKV